MDKQNIRSHYDHFLTINCIWRAFRQLKTCTFLTFLHFSDELCKHRNRVIQLVGGQTNGNLQGFIRFVLDTKNVVITQSKHRFLSLCRHAGVRVSSRTCVCVLPEKVVGLGPLQSDHLLIEVPWIFCLLAPAGAKTQKKEGQVWKLIWIKNLEPGLNHEQKFIFSASGVVKYGFEIAHLQNHHLLRAEEGDVPLCSLCQQCHQAHQHQTTLHSSTLAHSAPSWIRKHMCSHLACMCYNGGWSVSRCE